MSKNPTSPESSEVHTAGGKSAKLASQYVGVKFLNMGKFAAGNVFTGHFCSANMKTYQAKINFGQPFSSRPTQLTGWFKYNRGTEIDEGSGSYKTILEAAGGDLCSIYIALTDNAGFNYDGKNSNVVLVQGSVEVTTGSRDKVTMRPSQLLGITDGKLDGLRTVDTSQYTSWMSDIMDLHGDGIRLVVDRLNHYYGTDIGVRGNFSSTPLYGKLVYQKNIDEVLKAINIITGTRLAVSGGKVYISK